MGVPCCKHQISSDPQPAELRQQLLKIDPLAETSFLELSSPKFGRKITWKRGKLVGEGCFGKVYQCLNTRTGELMAVKHWDFRTFTGVISFELESIQAEIQVLRGLSHPNIVTYFQTDLSASRDSVDVLMEYVAGDSLKLILQSYGKLQEEAIQHYALQLLAGLEYLHSQGVVHRDLKPANILIGKDGIVKLADFGAAKQFVEAEPPVSLSVKGSPFWMAPEVVLRHGHSFAADVWSFGCILVEMASGQPPWSNYSHSARAVMTLVGTPGRLPDFPNCSQALTEVIALCLRRDPVQRARLNDLRDAAFFATSCKSL